LLSMRERPLPRDHSYSKKTKAKQENLFSGEGYAIPQRQQDKTSCLFYISEQDLLEWPLGSKSGRTLQCTGWPSHRLS
jgi:hypothetical protein